MKENSTILIAYMPNPQDWLIANEALRYRIPKVNAPKIIKEKTAEYIGFYFPSAFGKELKWKVTHYGKIKSITEVNRRKLFPKEPINAKSATQYYKIAFEPLVQLPKPFQSRRGHRLVFVSTTKEKFFSAETDFNLLFQSSSHE